MINLREKAGRHKPHIYPFHATYYLFCLPAAMAAQPYELLRNAAEFSKISISMPY